MAAQDCVGLLVRSFVQIKLNIAMNDLENDLKKKLNAILIRQLAEKDPPLRSALSTGC